MSELYAGSPVAPLVADGARLAVGQVGVIVARPGTGKTTLLVHVALEALLRGRSVLHVSLLDTVDHARAHYDEVMRAIGDRCRVPDATVRVERHRMIHSFHGRPFDVSAVKRNLQVLVDAAQFLPELLVVDGLDGWSAVSAHLPALAALATERQLAVWVSVRSPDPAPPEVAERATRLVRLEPAGALVKLLAQGPGGSTELLLDAGSLMVAGQTAPEAPVRASAQECTLYSGGAFGAEVAFGESAERAGVHEVNFTFDGHLQIRSRGRYELSPRELAMGDVSLSYVSKRLNRTYSDRGGLIRSVLQTLWHMVSRSQQVFVVGAIQEDGTVVGGTGWSVELARIWHRELWVYDQQRRDWFRWDGSTWAAGTPVITATHVCGTGTRYLTDDGKAAIEALFQRSFAG
ncbi:MAG: AAA family ATPase [Myxococcales bacterium]|nr:AAA family ATPase [Myxococcales bacterium]